MFLLSYIIIPFGAAGLTVLVHRLVMDQVSHRFGHVRNRIAPAHTVMAVLILLGAHLVEIALFAIGFALLTEISARPLLTGDFTASFQDYLYYSGTSYTSLGIGDIAPHGPARLMSAMEALTGLVMIAWTAAFLYAEAIY